MFGAANFHLTLYTSEEGMALESRRDESAGEDGSDEVESEFLILWIEAGGAAEGDVRSDATGAAAG